MQQRQTWGCCSNVLLFPGQHQHNGTALRGAMPSCLPLAHTFEAHCSCIPHDALQNMCPVHFVRTCTSACLCVFEWRRSSACCKAQVTMRAVLDLMHKGSLAKQCVSFLTYLTCQVPSLPDPPLSQACLWICLVEEAQCAQLRNCLYCFRIALSAKFLPCPFFSGHRHVFSWMCPVEEAQCSPLSRRSSAMEKMGLSKRGQSCLGTKCVALLRVMLRFDAFAGCTQGDGVLGLCHIRLMQLKVCGAWGTVPLKEANVAMERGNLKEDKGATVMPWSEIWPNWDLAALFDMHGMNAALSDAWLKCVCNMKIGGAETSLAHGREMRQSMQGKLEASTVKA
eukprot:scaffold5087_cov19-Tisochrysis_lutea.AAC.1